MRNYKKYNYIQKGLTQQCNSTKSIACTTVLAVVILFLLLFIINGNETATIQQLYNTYGKYTAQIPKLEGRDYSELYKDSRLESYHEINIQSVEEDGAVYNVYSSDENILSYLNLDLLEGEYPQQPNEIAVERKFLYRMGIQEQEALGKKIKFNDDIYTIKGIVIAYEADFGNYVEDGYTCIINDSNIFPNKILLQIKDIRSYEQILDSFVEEYGINGDECFANFNLFTALGYTVGQDTFQSNRYLYFVIFFVIMLVVLHATGNYLRMWVDNVSGAIANMNLIGVSYGLIRKALILYFMKWFAVYISVGVLISCILSIFIFQGMFSQIDISHIIAGFPARVLMFSILLYTIFFFGKLMWISKDIKMINPINNMHTKKRAVKNLNGSKMHLFTSKSKNYRWKIYRKNIRDDRFRVVISIIGISLTVSIFSIGSCFLTMNSQVFGHDTQMDYKIAFKPEYLLETGEEQQQISFYNNLLEMNERLDVWPVYTEKVDTRLNRENLSIKYIEYLQRIQENNLLIDLQNNAEIPLRVTVLGYNEAQLKELYKLNNLEYTELENNQIIVLKNTVPLRGEVGFDLNFKKSQSIQLENATVEQYEISQVVERLPIYSPESYNSVCFIVNESTFKQRNKLKVPPSFYIKLKREEYKTIIDSKVLGNPLVEITIPKEEERLLEESNKLLKGITISLLTIIIACIIYSINSNLILRYQINKEEYKIFNLLGVSYKDNIIILLYEVSELILGGIIISIPIVYMTTYIMQVLMLGDAGRYIYRFPVEDYVTVTLIFLCCSSIIGLVAKKIKRYSVL